MSFGSPFQCGGTAKIFPIGAFTRLVIRIDDTADTAKVYIKIGANPVASATNADYFLNAGDALELKHMHGEQVSIVDASDNPLIYWSKE